MGMIGISPTEFWNMSIIEVHSAIEGFMEFNGAEKDTPMDKKGLNELMELYPD
jgi:hypothetical protein|tara:strand:+ start:948 stop:1106 length:159 start_codon:yes stop_codon:yes gene_type:complete